MGANWVDRWPGGRVREVDGRRIWVIERQVRKQRRAISLDVNSEKDAMAELALFERDPDSYRTKRQAAASAPGAAVLDSSTLGEFAKHANAQGLSDGYKKHILEHYLADWSAALRGRDLRTVTLREIRAMLKTWEKGRRHRIVALRSFTAWLREEDRLRRAEDPTLDLKVPQPRAEKSVRQKGYTMAQVEAAYAEAPSQLLRDVLCLRAKTGMHDTEIARVATGEAKLREVNDPSGIKGTVTFAHLKAGKTHVVSLDAQTFAAARRLAARGRPLTRAPQGVMLKRVAKRLTAAARRDDPNAPEVEAIEPGELRHSFATWARASGRIVRPTEGGVPLAEIAAVMGHLTPRTTKVFYEGNEVPAMISVPIKLEHPNDPPIAQPSSPRRKAARASATR